MADEQSVATLARESPNGARCTPWWPTPGSAGPTAPLHEIALADWRDCLATDLDGVFLTFRAFVPAMITARTGSPDRDLLDDRQASAARPHPVRRGQDGRDRPGPDAGAGAGTARHPGQRGLPGRGDRAADGRRVRRQAAARGITEAEARASFTAASPLHRLVEADEVAAACTYLASDAAASITGEDLNVNAGVVMY